MPRGLASQLREHLGHGTARIRRRGHCTPEHDVPRARLRGFTRRDDPRLILRRSSGQANAGHERRETASEPVAHRPGLVPAAHDPEGARVVRQLREPEYLRSRVDCRRTPPGRRDLLTGERREHRDGEDAAPLRIARGLGGRTHHLLPTRGMHGDEPDTERRRATHRTSHRVGNVVELEVEEHIVASLNELRDNGWPSGGEQLAPNLEKAARASW